MTLTRARPDAARPGHGPGVEDKLDELKGLAREALAEMRNLIFELRPGSLAEDGFLPALRRHVTSVEARTGLVVRVEADTGSAACHSRSKDALYRITQEAVHKRPRSTPRAAGGGSACALGNGGHPHGGDDGAASIPAPAAEARARRHGVARRAARQAPSSRRVTGPRATVRVSIPLDGARSSPAIAPRARRWPSPDASSAPPSPSRSPGQTRRRPAPATRRGAGPMRSGLHLAVAEMTM